MPVTYDCRLLQTEMENYSVNRLKPTLIFHSPILTTTRESAVLSNFAVNEIHLMPLPSSLCEIV